MIPSPLRILAWAVFWITFGWSCFTLKFMEPAFYWALSILKH